MTYQINITEQAENDLRDAYEYIAHELQSIENAIGQLSRLEKAILSLDHIPLRHKLYEKEPWRSRGLRIMPVDNFIVFYIPYPGTLNVEVIRVMYGGRDVDTQLNRITND